MISVIILTFNEERDLPGCLASVAWCDDVHVFDSYSSDATLYIARSAGARVTQRRFDNYAAHRNAALDLATLQHDWVLFLDADERVPRGLREEMCARVDSAPPDVVAFRIRRRDYLMGRWLKHAQISPFYIRLMRRGRARYERDVNEVVRIRGGTADLAAHFDHFPFSKGLAHWIDKHNRYSTTEAKIALAASRNPSGFAWHRAFLARDFNERRFHQKELFYRLPARPLVKLLYMLILRRAFLDGTPGISYALLQCFYEWLIVLKTAELERAHQGDVLPEADPRTSDAAEVSVLETSIR